MECYSSFTFRLRPCYTFSSFFLFLLILSSTQMRSMAKAGRANPKSSDLSEIGEEDQKATLTARIGSRPPKCERRCSWCMHCEAIQVPTNHQVQNGKTSTSTAFGVVAHARREDNSNYKPMSWKCKCGNFIFNP